MSETVCTLYIACHSDRQGYHNSWTSYAAQIDAESLVADDQVHASVAQKGYVSGQRA